MNRSVRVPSAPPAPPQVGSSALPLPEGVSAERIVKTTWKQPIRVGQETRQNDSRGFHFRSPPQPETHLSKMAADHPAPIQGTKLPDGTTFHPTQQFEQPPSMRSMNPFASKRLEVTREIITEAMPAVQLPHSVENTILYVPVKKNCKVDQIFTKKCFGKIIENCIQKLFGGLTI